MEGFVYKFHGNSQLNVFMASTEPKMCCIIGNLVTNVFIEQEDDFTYKVTYVANHTIKAICKLVTQNGNKFSASGLEIAYDDLFTTSKREVYSISIVEFGFTNNSLRVNGSFSGPKTQFTPSRNSGVI